MVLKLFSGDKIMAAVITEQYAVVNLNDLPIGQFVIAGPYQDSTVVSAKIGRSIKRFPERKYIQKQVLLVDSVTLTVERYFRITRLA